MPDFDVPKVREAAARAEFRMVYGSAVSWERARGPLQEAYLRGAAAAMSVIVPAVTAQIRALHAEWMELLTDPELEPYERSAIRMCAAELGRKLTAIENAVRADS